MASVRDVLNIILDDHTIGQKTNYIKFAFSKKGEVLRYDPVVISIVATSRCTLSCDMCPTHSGVVPDGYPYKQKNANDIDFNTFRDMIDRFKNAVTVHIIGSGEPLLNKDFFRMVEYAAGKRMKVKTFSNGTIIEENIDNILASRLDGITISLNGQDSKEFKRMTGMSEEAYKKIYRATEKLVLERDRRSSPVKIKLSFIIDSFNYKSIPSMVRVGIDLGVDHIFFCNFLTAPYKGIDAEERLLRADRDVLDEIRVVFKSYPLSIRKKLTAPLLIDDTADRNCCNTHFAQIRFDGDGNISSCSMMLLNMTGNGNYRDEDAWNNPFFRNMRNRFLMRDGKSLPPPCATCPDNKGVAIGR